MTAHIKYSVIIPVYNGEKTLHRCLDSLLKAGRTDIQLIVINDGSTDDSDGILRDYAARHGEIRYITQTNAGVSRARNNGLDHAEGEFVTFVDCDDYVSDDYFSLLDTADDSDLVVFGNHFVGGAEPDESALFAQLLALDSAARLALLLSSRKIMSPWNKRFKRSFVEAGHLRFAEGLQIGEDFNFCFAYAIGCHSIGILADKLCCIDISGEDSLSRKYRPHLDDQMCRVFRLASETDAQGAYSGILDYLFVKNVFTSVAEEFKNRELPYFRNRREIKAICDKFRTPIGPVNCGIVHKGVRLLLRLRFDFLIYLVAYLARGRKFKKHITR